MILWNRNAKTFQNRESRWEKKEKRESFKTRLDKRGKIGYNRCVPKKNADVAQWQSVRFPSRKRGFDSRHLLQYNHGNRDRKMGNARRKKPDKCRLFSAFIALFYALHTEHNHPSWWCKSSKAPQDRRKHTGFNHSPWNKTDFRGIPNRGTQRVRYQSKWKIHIPDKYFQYVPKVCRWGGVWKSPISRSETFLLHIGFTSRGKNNFRIGSGGTFERSNNPKILYARKEYWRLGGSKPSFWYKLTKRRACFWQFPKRAVFRTDFSKSGVEPLGERIFTKTPKVHFT